MQKKIVFNMAKNCNKKHRLKTSRIFANIVSSKTAVGWFGLGGRGIKYQIFGKTAKTSPQPVNRLNQSPGVDDEYWTYLVVITSKAEIESLNKSARQLLHDPDLNLNSSSYNWWLAHRLFSIVSIKVTNASLNRVCWSKSLPPSICQGLQFLPLFVQKKV